MVVYMFVSRASNIAVVGEDVSPPGPNTAVTILCRVVVAAPSLSRRYTFILVFKWREHAIRLLVGNTDFAALRMAISSSETITGSLGAPSISCLIK